MRSNFLMKGIRAVWNMKATVPLMVHLMKDARVDRINKFVFLFVTVGYLLFPYDFIFDLPIFGQFDDLAILLFMVNWFIGRTPETILKEYGWNKERNEREKRGRKAEKKQNRKQ